MGWNTLHVVNPHPLLARHRRPGPHGLHAYFVHSFQLVPERRSAIVAETDYGGAGHGDGGHGQHGRHAVPPREEPDARPEADRQLPQVAALAIGCVSRTKTKPPPRRGRGPCVETKTRRSEREIVTLYVVARSRQQASASGSSGCSSGGAGGAGKAITLESSPISIAGAPLAEPAQRRVGQHRIVLHGLDQQAVVGLEQAESCASMLLLARLRPDVPGLLERARPGLAERHDLLRQHVLVAVGVGEVVGDDEGAHGDVSLAGASRGETLRLTPDCASFAAAERNENMPRITRPCPAFVLIPFLRCSRALRRQSGLRLPSSNRASWSGWAAARNAPVRAEIHPVGERWDSAPRTAPRPWRARRQSAPPPRSRRAGAGRSHSGARGRDGGCRASARSRCRRHPPRSADGARRAAAGDLRNAKAMTNRRRHTLYRAGLDFAGRDFSIGSNVSDLMTVVAPHHATEPVHLKRAP